MLFVTCLGWDLGVTGWDILSWLGLCGNIHKRWYSKDVSASALGSLAAYFSTLILRSSFCFFSLVGHFHHRDNHQSNLSHLCHTDVVISHLSHKSTWSLSLLPFLKRLSEAIYRRKWITRTPYKHRTPPPIALTAESIKTCRVITEVASWEHFLWLIFSFEL